MITNTVLVLEGGGLRGAFVAGALSELAGCEGLRFTHIFATSAAAASAAYMVAGQIDRGLEIWRERTHGAQLISPRHLLRGRGLMDIEGLIDVFRGELSLDAARVELSTTALCIAVTNCMTGAADHVTANRTNVYDLLRATMALPVVYGRVVRVDGVPYIDGGVADAIPLEPALELRPERIIVIATRPNGYRKRPTRLGALLRYNYKGFPALWPPLENRWQTYNRSITQVETLERQGRVQVIRPAAVLPASRMTRDRGRILQTLELGQSAARDFLIQHGLAPAAGVSHAASAAAAAGAASGA